MPTTTYTGRSILEEKGMIQELSQMIGRMEQAASDTRTWTLELMILAEDQIVTEFGIEAEEAQYFLDMTGAKAISGYGRSFDGITSVHLDMVFFHLFEEDDNMLEVVEALHQKHYKACKLLDFRMYY